MLLLSAKKPVTCFPRHFSVCRLVCTGLFLLPDRFHNGLNTLDACPKGWPLRYVGALCWLPLFLSVPTHPGYGEAHINVFDVEQGSAVFIETQKHRLLFDTGPLYLPKSDAVDRTILPYLQSRGIGKLDAIIVSHGDNDHSGGLLTLTREIPVSKIHSSMPHDSLLVRVLPKHRPCLAGRLWEWEGIRFEILYSDSVNYLDKLNKTNNLSCVLKV
jgi:competence protein ComEC